MDIYEYAMKMEKDGENYYRELAENTNNKGLKNILVMLADEEVKHYNIFRQMKAKEKIEIRDSEIFSRVKNVFTEMRENKEVTDVNFSQIDLYKKAQEIEKRSRDFYLEKADELEEASSKELFLKIADEEKRHYFILEKIIDFVSRPSQWLENPEWHHLEEY